MNDDWRLRVALREEGVARRLSESLEAQDLEHELENAFHERVVVSREAAELLCYAGSREQAEKAERLIRSLAERHGWHVECELRRWHPAEEQWEDPDKPLPASDGERAAEHEELIKREEDEARERGWPEFEVRVECASHRDAVELANRLRAEGMAPVHRFRYVLVGALDEDMATELAERLRGEVPAGSTVSAEGTWKAMLAERPRNPFAVLGGLGG